MTDDTTSPKADRTEHWDRKSMEIDDAGESREPAGPDATHWNKGEMGEERQDGSRAPLPSDNEMGQAGGLTGEGSNPGGGERWAERDTED